MKDRTDVIRGNCLLCECVEYTLNSKSNKCEDCGCPAAKHREIEYAEDRGDSIGAGNYINGRFKTFGLWFLCSAACAYAGVKYQHQLYRFDRDFAPSVYFAGGFTFFWIGMSCVVAYMCATSPTRRALAKGLAVMNFTVMSVYVLHYFKLTPYFKDEQGYPVDLCRYIEWFFDMENLATVIGFVCQVHPALTQRAVWNVYALTITGLIGSITTGYVSQWMLLFSYGTHCIAVQALWDMYTLAIDGKTESKSQSKSLLESSRFITAYAWHAFALVHALVRFDFISFAQGEALYFLSHILAKIPLTLIFLYTVPDSIKRPLGNFAQSAAIVD